MLDLKKNIIYLIYYIYLANNKDSELYEKFNNPRWYLEIQENNIENNVEKEDIVNKKSKFIL